MKLISTISRGCSARAVLVLLAICAMGTIASAQTVPVQATLTDGAGNPVAGSFLRFQLWNCGQNFPTLNFASVVIVQKQFDLPVNSLGQITGQVIPNDQISCGGVASTRWIVTPFKDDATPLNAAQRFNICSATAVGSCANTPGGTFNPAFAQSDTAQAQQPGFTVLFANPILNQTWLQPGGTTGFFRGAFDFTGATVKGITTTGAPAISINGIPLPGTVISANFNNAAPAAQSGSLLCGFQNDVSGDISVECPFGSYLALAGGTLTGALTLAADPVSSLQAATKEYVDALGAGFVQISANNTFTGNNTFTHDVTFSGNILVGGNIQQTSSSPWDLSGKQLSVTTPTVQGGYDFALGVGSDGLFKCVLANSTSCSPSGAVGSVFGRSGTVTAQSGDYTVAQVTGAAPLASPTFTGTPLAPTPSTADNSTKIATTAYVQAQGYGSTTVSVNGSTVSTPNFNHTTPSPDSGFLATTWKSSGSSVIAEVPDLINGTNTWAGANTFSQTLNGTNIIYSGTMTGTSSSPTQWSGIAWTTPTVSVPGGFNFSIGLNNSNQFACVLPDTTSCLAADVQSVFGRTGTITATPGDYSLPQITGFAANSAGFSISGGSPTSKTVTFDNSLELAGTDGTKGTFPSTNWTAARTDAAQTFTGTQTFGSGPAITGGSGGAIGYGCGSAATGAAASATFYCDAANLFHIVGGVGGTADLGPVATQSQTIALISDWSCGTGGTVSSCSSAQTIGTLSFALPLEALNWTMDCSLVVGQATSATTNFWDIQTATNGVTNLEADYSMATAATASAYGALTGVGATTSAQVISPGWTLGGTATKMPVHIHASVKGASASGTVLNLQLVAPTPGDLVTIYSGSGCSIH